MGITREEGGGRGGKEQAGASNEGGRAEAWIGKGWCNKNAGSSQ